MSSPAPASAPAPEGPQQPATFAVPTSLAPQSASRVDRRKLALGAPAAVDDRVRQPRPSLAPTWRLAVLLGVVGAAHFVMTTITHSAVAGWLLLGLDAACLGIAAWDVSRLPPPSKLGGTRRSPKLWSLRVPEQLTVTVTNTSRRTVRGRLVLPLPAPLVTGVDTVRLRVPKRSYASATFEVTGIRRGRHSVEPLELDVASPLGLMRRRYGLCRHDVISVYPNLYEARRLEVSVKRRRDDVGLRRAHMLGIGTDFESLREYRPDDDFRMIDWHATARKGVLIARSYRIERNQNVVFVVDTGRLMAAPVGPIRRLDAALNAATAMAFACGQFDDRVGLVAFDSKLHTRIDPARNKTDVILAAMCSMEPRRVESDYALAFRIAGGAKRGLIVLFTDLLEESASRRLLEAMPTLARRHFVVVASVLDPDFTDTIEQPPQSTMAAFRQAVAIDLVRRRREVVGNLRRLGVDVVEAPPQEFSASLVDAYLRIKSRAKV